MGTLILLSAAKQRRNEAYATKRKEIKKQRNMSAVSELSFCFSLAVGTEHRSEGSRETTNVATIRNYKRKRKHRKRQLIIEIKQVEIIKRCKDNIE